VASLRDRFFVEGVHALGERVAFAADDAHKIATVLRGRTGERIEVVDSGGNAWSALLDVSGAKVAAVLDEALARPSRETRTRITIAQAVPKGAKMDTVVEKATELGVAALIPLRTLRVTGDHTGDAKIERWRRLARSAAQQCGRSVVPTVAPVATWDELLATFDTYDRVYVPWELAEPQPLRETFERDAQALASVLFVIGPEGGLAAGEVERACTAGGVPVSLGSRILRTETVALVVLTAFLYARGEL
jgi:16S rRNA (uracil1498-N3)-methyltransferase